MTEEPMNLLGYNVPIMRLLVEGALVCRAIPYPVSCYDRARKMKTLCI